MLSLLTGSPVMRWLLLAVIAAGGIIWGAIIIDGRGYDRGHMEARLQARAQTMELINELSSTADDARIRRRACLGAGGVWSLADNKCRPR